MANTFYAKYGAATPDLINTLTDDAGDPIELDGDVVMRVWNAFAEAVDVPCQILDQGVTANIGKVRVNAPAINPDTAEPFAVGEYKVEWRYTSSAGDLMISPTEESPYDVPVTDTLVIQKAG